MYWGQVAAGVAAAIGTGYWVQSLGRPVSVAIAAAVVAYSVVRWLLAWAYRTRFWVRQSGRGHRVECPNCHARRHRIGGDWVLQCKKCGWKAGWPIVRWVTRSVPARQLRRTIVGPKLVVVVLAVAVIATGGVGALSVPSDSPAVDATDAPGDDNSTPTPVSELTPTPAAESTPAGTPTPELSGTPQPNVGDTPDDPSAGLNVTAIARTVHRFVNEERQQRGLQPLAYDTELERIARYHSEDMATNRYFAHVSPDDETMNDRYERFDYECRVSTGENSYLTGAENIAYTYAYQSVNTDRGIVSYDGNETAIASGIVRGWMNSPPHRKNILRSEWNNEGIGIYIHDGENGTRVYATQNFC